MREARTYWASHPQLGSSRDVSQQETIRRKPFWLLPVDWEDPHTAHFKAAFALLTSKSAGTLSSKAKHILAYSIHVEFMQLYR